MVKIMNFEEGGGVKTYWAINRDTECDICGTELRFEKVREFTKVRYNVHKGEVAVWVCPVCGAEWEWHQFPEDLRENECFITPHILAGNQILLSQATWRTRGRIEKQIEEDNQRFKVRDFVQSATIKQLHAKLKDKVAAKEKEKKDGIDQ